MILGTAGAGRQLVVCCPSPAPLTDAESQGAAVAAIRRTLSESPYRAVRRIDCSHRDGLIVLAGRVSNYFQRQMALAAAKVAAPAAIILDEVRVVGARPR